MSKPGNFLALFHNGVFLEPISSHDTAEAAVKAGRARCKKYYRKDDFSCGYHVLDLSSRQVVAENFYSDSYDFDHEFDGEKDPAARLAQVLGKY